MKMNDFKILVVDDDEELVSVVKELLERNNYQVEVAYSGQEAIDKFYNDQSIKIALVDLVMPVMDGFAVIEKLKEIDKNIDIIIITAHGTISTAVEAIKKGATDFIIKPYDQNVILSKLRNISENFKLKHQVKKLKNLISEQFGFDEIITHSRTMKNVFENATSAANSDANVLILGETGTGKGLIAKAIHLKSNRNNEPFVTINCASIPKELLESELFGHKKGSFTGAIRDHEGLFLSARKGTIFLDEIGEMPKDLQVKLLRALEERKIRAVGGSQEVEYFARIIAATNRSLKDLRDKFLREDLFFRLAVIVIELPPLRERKDDMPLLVDYFLKKFNNKYMKGIENINDKALQHLYSYNFPGNIRELENLLERIIATVPSNKTQVNEKDIKTHSFWSDNKKPNYKMLQLSELEKFAILQALRESDGNKSEAAKILGISRDTLYRKLKTYNLEKK